MIQILKRLSAGVCCLFLMVCVFCQDVCAAPDWPDGVSVQAEAGIVIDADTGTVLWGQNIHSQYFPASITKVMTALLVIENCDLDEMVTFSHNAVFNVESGSSNASINEGDVLSVKDCLYALLLKSANESANALAEHVSGTTEAFAALMNARAKELGCLDTHFANPSGLNNPDHYTSAYDMALISKAAFANPVFAEIDSTTYYKLPPNSINPEGLTIYPGHKMLKKNNPYYYPGIVGGKTGYTTLAGNTLVTCAEKNGMKLIAVILKGTTPQYWTDTKHMLDFGFSNFVSLKAADYETNYTSLTDDLSFSGLTIDKPAALILDGDSRITLPKTAEFTDAQSELSYDISPQDPKNAIAKIFYRYGERVVGCTYVEINDALFGSSAGVSEGSGGMTDGIGDGAGNGGMTDGTGDGAGSGIMTDGAGNGAAGGVIPEKTGGGAGNSLIPEGNGNGPAGTDSQGNNMAGSNAPSESTEDYREKALRPFEIPGAAWMVLIGFVVLLVIAGGITAFIIHKNNEARDLSMRHERRLRRLEESGLSADEFNALLSQRHGSYSTKRKRKKTHLKFK